MPFTDGSCITMNQLIAKTMANDGLCPLQYQTYQSNVPLFTAHSRLRHGLHVSAAASDTELWEARRGSGARGAPVLHARSTARDE